MSGDETRDRDFKVEDRRTSSGAPDGGEESPEPEQPEDGHRREEPESAPKSDSGEAVKVDFSTFVFSLFSSALIQLGDMADPISGSMDPNMPAAKQTIDIIDILREKTAGNLSEEENKLLENAAAELKWKYLDAVKKKD